MLFLHDNASGDARTTPAPKPDEVGRADATAPTLARRGNHHDPIRVMPATRLPLRFVPRRPAQLRRDSARNVARAHPRLRLLQPAFRRRTAAMSRANDNGSFHHEVVPLRLTIYRQAARRNR